MSYRIFISSVQREFAKERKALASYIRKDAILGKFFDVFLFEEVPAPRIVAVTVGELDGGRGMWYTFRIRNLVN